MKNIFLVLLMCLASWQTIAQTNAPQDTAAGTVQNDLVPDSGEAGGISVGEVNTDKKDSTGYFWLYLFLGAVGIAVISSLATRASIRSKTSRQQSLREAEMEAVSEKSKETKTTPAEVKKLKQEIKNLNAQLEQLKNTNSALQQSINTHNNFDNAYFNEAFRKLTIPVNDALEKGSRKDIMENLLKIMIHFTSLTRYKIAKKQHYDEANIQYLLNQKSSNDATEINHATPVDKIPKNIKIVADLLQEQGSKGLDDSILLGYKIKNL